ncbi:retroviral-like aspartic protease family protein [Sphingomonas sp.]|jgi:predicted aspartyl protease|uniref:retroviral-like aspartic protease family protein n=1 Tax=Sphingomonas sp. TaxID=28214 RepID=UPI0035C81A5C
MERWSVSALIALAAPVAAQQPTLAPIPATPPAAAPDPTPSGDDLSFLTTETRMTVPVRVAGAGPYPFIIDTGAQRSVVSRQLARLLRLPLGPRVRVTAMAGSGEVDTVIVPSLAVATLPAGSIGGRAIQAPALEASHLGAPGMLGIDTLQGHALRIDFDRDAMTVVPVARRRHRAAADDEIVIQARSLYGQLVVTHASVAGRKVRVVLDTGTATSVGNLALRRLLARRGKAREPAIFTSVLGQQMVGDIAVVPEMRLGSARIRSLPVAFADAAPFRAFGLNDRPAIMLGMDALRLFRRVDIDFANRELRLVMPRDAVS